MRHINIQEACEKGRRASKEQGRTSRRKSPDLCWFKNGVAYREAEAKGIDVCHAVYWHLQYSVSMRHIIYFMNTI
jgi:hypothetical protein